MSYAAYVNRRVEEERASIEGLRAVLTISRNAIAKLSFSVATPAGGYDANDVVAMLDDMMPPTGRALDEHLANFERSLLADEDATHADERRDSQEAA